MKPRRLKNKRAFNRAVHQRTQQLFVDLNRERQRSEQLSVLLTGGVGARAVLENRKSEAERTRTEFRDTIITRVKAMRYDYPDTTTQRQIIKTIRDTPVELSQTGVPASRDTDGYDGISGEGSIHRL